MFVDSETRTNTSLVGYLIGSLVASAVVALIFWAIITFGADRVGSGTRWRESVSNRSSASS